LIFIYNTFVFFYLWGIHAMAFVNEKARLWVSGRKNILQKISDILQKDNRKKIAWFHCASLGEFEQGRPLIEAFREARPDYRIFLTFFSPSGYEVRKNYPGADYVFYLPADTPRNSARFLKILSPEIVFFIKYEYWYNYLAVLKKQGIPVYMVSAIFRPSQPFFRWYGSWFRKQLNHLSWFFVQDENSERLLHSIGIEKVSVSGDTRFDRVSAIAGQEKKMTEIDDFCGDSQVIIAGSTWPEDEKILFPFIQDNKAKYKFIIASHEADKQRIDRLLEQLGEGSIRYTGITQSELQEARVLVIDTIGLLAFLYKYAFISYIGGGFGVGIHNILEPAAFGVPVIFGPNYQRFREARELIQEGGAISIKNPEEFGEAFSALTMPAERDRVSQICLAFIKANQGATSRILNHISSNS